ncbi:hypothetical protein [Actinocrispum wychmicini]|uniref:hypothetical protein n=1 Tax=Actinocrispum wychmicini TaxID=1213861 RepID=UPI0010518E3D|nr:hypothetical protein [Actinocrispum wychmicini]
MGDELGWPPAITVPVGVPEPAAVVLGRFGLFARGVPALRDAVIVVVTAIGAAGTEADAEFTVGGAGCCAVTTTIVTVPRPSVSVAAGGVDEGLESSLGGIGAAMIGAAGWYARPTIPTPASATHATTAAMTAMGLDGRRNRRPSCVTVANLDGLTGSGSAIVSASVRTRSISFMSASM